jgi:hypothetical protein
MAALPQRSCTRFPAPLFNNRLRLIKALLGIIGVGVISSVCHAGQYYKWVDDKGVTHFSEKPVVGTEAQKMGTSSKTAQATDEPEAPAATETPTAEGGATPQVSNDENCKIAQDRMKALQSGQRIRLVGPDGKFSYLDQNQIKEEMQKTQDVLKANCSSAAK